MASRATFSLWRSFSSKPVQIALRVMAPARKERIQSWAHCVSSPTVSLVISQISNDEGNDKLHGRAADTSQHKISDLSTNLSHQFFDPRSQRQKNQSRDDRDRRQLAEEPDKRLLRSSLEVAGGDARGEIAERDREEPDAHHQPGQAMRRELRRRAEADRIQTYLANSLQRVDPEQPIRSDFGAARREERCGSYHRSAKSDKQKAEREFHWARRLSLAHPQPEPHKDRGQNYDEDCRTRLIISGGKLTSEYEAVGEVPRKEVEA